MTRMEKFLKELCPGGVHNATIGNLIDYEQPTKYLVASKSYDDSYSTPVLTAGQSFLLGYTNEEHGKYPATSESPVIIFDDFTTAYKWVDFEFKVKSSAMKMLTVKEGAPITLRYFWYALSTIRIETSEHARYWISKYSLMEIPLPPLEVQYEIVNMLDKFTALEAELEAELEARRTQFAFLLDKAFNNDEIRKSGLTKLGDHGEFDRGNGLQKTDFSENGVGCIHYGQIYTKFGSHANEVYTYVPEALAARLKKVDQGNLVITTTSENIQDVCKAVAWLGESEIVIGGHSCVYRHDLDPLFATYLFRSRLFQDQKNSYVQGTKVKDIKPAQIGKIEVYVPPMKKQIEIGLMMRNFDALLQDASIGLPAEIAARRQQYEYYRGKLLTFKELEVA